MAYTSTRSSVVVRASVPVCLQWMPGGDLGTITTLLTMRNAAMHAARDPLLIRTAEQATGGARDRTAIAVLLRAFVAGHTRFAPDPLRVCGHPVADVVFTPRDQLLRIAREGVAQADCDDVATLAAALAAAVGQRARFVVLGFSSPTAPYRHVFTEVLGSHGWVNFDVTRTGRTPAPRRVAVMEV